MTPDEERRFKVVASVALAGAGALTLWALSGTLTVDRFAVVLTVVTAAVPVAYFVFLFSSREVTAEERKGLFAYVWLFLAAAIFWLVYDQAGSALLLFAKNDTDLDVLGFTIPPGWVGNINSLVIILVAPSSRRCSSRRAPGSARRSSSRSAWCSSG